MGSNLDRICTVDISLASPISNDANFDTVMILGPAPKKAEDLPLVGAYSSLEELTSMGVVATGEDADPIGIAARVAFSQSPRPHTVYISYMGTKPMPKSEVPVLWEPEKELLGKKMSELMGDDVEVLEDGSVIGTFHYVKNFTGFDKTNNNGYFFGGKFPDGAKKIKFVKNGSDNTEKTIDEDRAFIIKIEQGQTWQFYLDDAKEPWMAFNFDYATFESMTGVISAKPDRPTKPLTVSEVLQAAIADNGWYCLCPIGLEHEQTKEVIQWIETQTKLCGYIEDDPEDPIVENGLYLRSYPVFPHTTDNKDEWHLTPSENLYGMAVALAVKAMNFHAGEETWVHKELATVSPAELSTTYQNTLEDADTTCLLRIGGKNITIGGKTNGGEWIDVIRFRDWLQNDMQVRVVNLLVVNPKIPYTDNGIALVENQMLASLKDGQKYGGIAPTEYDANGEPIPGYVTQVPLSAEITSTQKASRVLTDCKFSARLAGAIHVVEIKGCLTYETL